MSKLLQTIIIGAVTGSLYSLLALGMVLVYRTTGVLNIAHGGVGVLAGFVAWDLVQLRGWPYYPGLLAGIALAVVLGLAFERFVVRGLPNPGSRTVATLGLFLLAQGVVFAVPWWSNNSAQVFPSPFTGRTVRIPGADYTVSYDQLALIATVGLLFAGLRFMLRRTRIGMAMRAVADDPAASRMMGVREELVSPVVWAMAFAIAALSVMLIAPVNLLENTSIVAFTLKALAVTFVGGLVSLPLTVLGATILALLEAFTQIYAADVRGLPSAWPFILMVAVLVVRLIRPTKALDEQALATA
jgi:branched-subunit amino acid ABC-type transport system permease component